MKQDKAESAAVAAALPYGLRLLPVLDVPQLQCLAPDLDLFAKPAKPAEPVAGPLPEELREKFTKLRDEFAVKAGQGLYHCAADVEWRRLPIEWRECLLRIAGVQAKTKRELTSLASRAWQEIPPPEQEALRRVVSSAKQHLMRLTALAARV